MSLTRGSVLKTQGTIQNMYLRGCHACRIYLVLSRGSVLILVSLTQGRLYVKRATDHAHTPIKTKRQTFCPKTRQDLICFVPISTKAPRLAVVLKTEQKYEHETDPPPLQNGNFIFTQDSKCIKPKLNERGNKIGKPFGLGPARVLQG